MQNVDISPAPRTFQFSLGSLLAFSAFVAVVCVAISTPTVVWSGIVVSLMFLSLCVAVAAAIYRSEEKRAFAIGFALFGWIYLTCLFLGQTKFSQFPVEDPAIPTTRFADWLYGQLHSGSVRTIPAPTPPMSGSMGGSGGMPGPGMGSGFGGGPGGGFSPGSMGPGPATYQVAIYDMRHFQEIVHASVALLLGLVGGVVTRMLFVTNRTNRRTAAG